MPDLFGDTGGETVDLNGVPIHVGMLDRTAQEAMVRDLRAVAKAAPFRRYETPGGRQMSVAMTAAGALGWMTDRSGYRYHGRVKAFADAAREHGLNF